MRDQRAKANEQWQKQQQEEAQQQAQRERKRALCPPKPKHRVFRVQLQNNQQHPLFNVVDADIQVVGYTNYPAGTQAEVGLQIVSYQHHEVLYTQQQSTQVISGKQGARPAVALFDHQQMLADANLDVDAAYQFIGQVSIGQRSLHSPPAKKDATEQVMVLVAGTVDPGNHLGLMVYAFSYPDTPKGTTLIKILE